jgi:phosphatidate cytidylyltransferase
MSAALSRVAVALAGLPIVLSAAYIGGWVLFVLAVIVALVALHELYRLARGLRPLVLAGYTGAAGVLVCAELGKPVWMLGCFLATFPLGFLFAAVAETRQSTTVAIGSTVLGAGWIGFGLGFLLLLREDVSETDGRQWLFTVLLAVFATDTLAYFGGRLAGRHKMTPVMSPGKTWEGFVFGAAAGVFTTWIAAYDTVYLESWRAFVLGGVIVLAATVGDLFESLAKRDLGAKDTGRLLLGHGGVLDRIDSLLFAGPAAYVALLALGEL